MKSQLKKLAQFILRQCAIRLLRKFNPEVIAVTGSVGKTSTKDAIYEVLKNKFDIRKTEGNLNTEIGVPLTIIGANSVRDIAGIIKGTFFKKEYPKVLILEMGADKPGDIRYLTSFIKPKISVVTKVACSHLEQFCDLKGVAKEKGTLVDALDKDGWAVLNLDDDNVREMSRRTNANKITFGFKKQADIFASDIDHEKSGIVFNVKYKNESEKIFLSVIGQHQAYSALAAIACGLVYGLSLEEISNSLEQYKLPKDRTNILVGKKNSFIISDVYNANPESMLAAFEALNSYVLSRGLKGRRVFVLGDMFELGEKSDELHSGVGEKLKKYCDIAVLCGERMKKVAGKQKKHFGEKMYWFEDSKQAGEDILKIIEKGDIILVKGSRGMEMEHVVEAIKV